MAASSVFSTGMDIDKVIDLTESIYDELNEVKTLDPVLDTLQLRVHTCGLFLFRYKTEDKVSFTTGFEVTSPPPRDGSELNGLRELYMALTDLGSAVSKLLKEVMSNPEASLIDKMRVIDRALNLEKIKQKVTDTEYGIGFLTDDADEE